MSARRFTARVLLASDPERIADPAPLPGVRTTRRAATVEPAVLERATKKAWYWPEAAASVARHRAHVELALAAEVGTAVERALALTRALASWAACPDTVAVLWDATELIHEPAQWIAQAEDASAEDLPLFLWIAFEGVENADGTRSLRTRGVTDFGALEVEVASSRRDGEELLETVCDVVLYALTSPAPPHDGDSIEVTRGKVRVRIEPSLRNDGTRAYRLRLP